MLISNVIRDVTDRQRVEERFQSLVETAPDAVVMVNNRDAITIVNSQAERLFGYARHELIGQPVDMLVPERFRGHHSSHRQSYLSDARVRPISEGLNLCGLRKNGEEFSVEIRISPLETEEEMITSSTIRDITEWKRIELGLVEKNPELARANQAKDFFLAGMSHELRAPLNAIIGFTGILLMGLPGPLTPDQERHLQTVRTSSRHLLSLINDLLDLARVEAGKTELSSKPVDCTEVLRNVAESEGPPAENKGVVLSVSYPPSPIVIQIDERSLGQILLNLVNYVVQGTNERGGSEA